MDESIRFSWRSFARVEEESQTISATHDRFLPPTMWLLERHHGPSPLCASVDGTVGESLGEFGAWPNSWLHRRRAVRLKWMVGCRKPNFLLAGTLVIRENND